MRITPSQAIERLTGGRKRAKGATPIVLAHTERYNRVGRLYVFNAGESLVVTPADDKLAPVIGMCDRNAFDAEDVPPGLGDWLGGLAKEIAWHQAHEGEEPVQMDAGPGRRDVAPMVEARWNQTSPYNRNLNFGDGACYVGCCAVAMAEIMHHWQVADPSMFWAGCAALPAYKTTTKKYQVAALPAVARFDFSNMTATKPKTSAQINAVAQFLEYVAKSVKSDFETTGTGAYNSACVAALAKYFRMGCPKQQLSSSMKAAKFEEIVYSELAAGRPLFMSGAKAANAGGHSFVCDGYDAASGLFHFNWGWGGSCDGYFALNALTPTGKDYSFNKRIITGIMPSLLGDVNGDGKVNVSDVMNVVNSITAGRYDVVADVNGDGKVDAKDVNAIVDKILG